MSHHEADIICIGEGPCLLIGLPLKPTFGAQHEDAGDKVIPSCGAVSSQVLGFHSTNAPLLRSKGGCFRFLHPQQQIGKRNAERRNFSTAATVVAARVLRDALTFRRSAAALTNGM